MGKRQRKMEASCEGGQGPEEAAAPYMELHILRETQTEREGERERQTDSVCVCVCVCVSVALVIQYTTHAPYYVVICGPSYTTVFFYITS